MTSAANRARQAQAVVEVLDFMRKHGLTLNDLIQISGEDFRSPSPTQNEKAHRVEKCWSLMARLSVRFADLEQAPGNLPTRPSRRRRGEGRFSEAVEITRVSETLIYHNKPNEINDLADSASVGGPQLNPEWTE
jgi:hypothetical protein